MTSGFWFDSTSDDLVAPDAAGACGGVADRNGECIGFLPTPFAGPDPIAPPPPDPDPAAIVPFIPTLFNPFHVPPGCQPHPYPGKNDHVPV